MAEGTIGSMPTLDKRVKRQIVGKTHRCFAATAPGLESLCAGELEALGAETIEAVERVHGGVEFQARLHDLHAANLHLRTATRILLRVAGFKATNFRELERKTGEVAWELYLGSPEPPEFVISTRSSRLVHTGAIAERMGRVIAGRLVEFATEREDVAPPPTIHVRAVQDRFLISIDSSGEPLYKRGFLTEGARAPLRETLASAVLLLSGYTGKEALLDPMCGSGTFAIEAALMARNRPPGLGRTFAFFGWPSFREKRWNHLIATARSTVREAPAPILASDRDPEACRKFAALVEKEEEIFGNAIRVREKDFFSLSPREVSSTPGVVVLNPPYGRRIGSHGSSLELYSRLRKRLEEEYAGWRFGVLVPRGRHRKLFPLAAARHPIHHGGLDLVLLTGRIPEK